MPACKRSSARRTSPTRCERPPCWHRPDPWSCCRRPSPATTCSVTTRIGAGASKPPCSRSSVVEGAGRAGAAGRPPDAGVDTLVASRRSGAGARRWGADRLRAGDGLLRVGGAGVVVVPQRGLLLRAAAPLAGARGRPPLGGGPHRLSPAAGARVAAGGRDPGSPGAPAACTLRCRGQRGPALVAPGADADAAGGAGEGCQHHLHGALVGASSGTDRVARRRRRALPGAA